MLCPKRALDERSVASPPSFIAALTILLSLTSFFPASASAQSPFSSCITNVDNATISFTMTGDITFPDGTAIRNGDQVAVYTSDGTCAGVTTWSTTTDNTLAAAGPSSAGTSDGGFAADETIGFRLWDESSNTVYYAAAVDYVDCSTIGLSLCDDDGRYNTGSIFFTSSLDLTALPVELTHFEAVPDGQRVRLTWTTASEKRNAGFHIQMSNGKSDWRDVAFVEGAGTTSMPQRYRFTTSRLTAGQYAFRLRQVDVDGTASLSDPISIAIEPRAGTLSRARPHPVRNRSKMELAVAKAQDIRVEIFDVLGRRVKTLYDGKIQPSNTVRLHVRAAALSPGRYFVRARGKYLDVSQSLVVLR